MSSFKISGKTRAEDHAIRAWLQERGASVASYAKEIDASALEKANVDLSALEKASAAAGHPGELRLDLLRKAAAAIGSAPAGAPADPLRSSPELAQAKLASVLGLADRSKEDLAAVSKTLAGGQLPTKADLVNLESRLKKLRWELDSFSSEGSREAAYLELSDFATVRERGLGVIEAHSGFAKALADVRGAGAKVPEAEKLDRIAEDIRQHAFQIGGWLRPLTDKAEVYRQEVEKLHQKAVDLFAGIGKDAAWVDAHFKIERDPEDPEDPKIRTMQKVDLDLSGKGLSRVLDGDWLEHFGDLDLADNQLKNGRHIPAHVHGDLDLSGNAFADLEWFGGWNGLIVDGKLDLSNNTSLETLDGLSKVKVAGDIDLRGVPATMLPYDYEHSGRLLLDASQTGLISSAKYGGIEVVISGDKKAFEVPADPAAFLLSLKTAAGLAPDDVRQVMLAIREQQKEQVPSIAAELGKRAASPDTDPAEARFSLRMLNNLDHEAFEAFFAPYVAQIPPDGGELPAALASLPMPMLERLASAAFSADLDERIESHKAKKETPKPIYPAWERDAPRMELVLDRVLDRARAGEEVKFGPLPFYTLWENDGDPMREGRTRTRDQAFEILAKQYTGARLEKGMLILTDFKGNDARVSDLLSRFKGYATSLEALERVLQRDPDNAVLKQLWPFLLEWQYTGDHVYVASSDAVRVAMVEDNLKVLRSPTPPMKAALEKVRGLERSSTPDAVKAALDDVRKLLPKLSEDERGALVYDLATQDLHELTRAGSASRLPVIAFASEVLAGLGPERTRRQVTPFLHALTEIVAQDPEHAAKAAALFPDLVHANNHGGSLGHTLRELGGVLEKSPAAKPYVEEARARVFEEIASPSASADRRKVLYDALVWASQWAVPPFGSWPEIAGALKAFGPFEAPEDEKARQDVIARVEKKIAPTT